MAYQVIIYTDGAASGNPGPGGLGVVLKAGNLRKELSFGFRKTTNNRMELLAVTRYVVDAVEKGWVFGWEKKGFKGKKNPDLWQRFLKVYRQHRVRFVWIKGHAANPENERCDQLAVAAYKQPNLLVDAVYEAEGGGNMKNLFTD